MVPPSLTFKPATLCPFPFAFVMRDYFELTCHLSSECVMGFLDVNTRHFVVTPEGCSEAKSKIKVYRNPG